MNVTNCGFEYNRVVLYNTYANYRPDLIVFLVNDETEMVKTVWSCYGKQSWNSTFDEFRDGAGTPNEPHNCNEISILDGVENRFAKNVLDNFEETRKVKNFFRSDTISEIIEVIKSNPRNLTRMRQEPVAWVDSAIRLFGTL